MVVFGVVVEEVLRGDNFRDGEHHHFLAATIAATGDFCSDHDFFGHHLVALHHGAFNGRTERVGAFHLRDTETAAAGVRLYEAGQTNAGNDVFIAHVNLVFAQEHRFGNVEVGVGAQEIVERIFVEGERFHEDIAR